jgi:ATP-dependent DNA helicase RecG
MNTERVKRLIKQKENIRLEFKEAVSALPGSLFETICAMLNREGGDILLGLRNDGTIIGVNKANVANMVTQLVNLSNNNQKLDPAFILYPQTYEIKGNSIIHIQVPASSQVHKTAGIVFDRSNDGDFRILFPHQIAELYNRKRNHYTEGVIYPAVRFEDFNPHLFPKVRALIKSNNASHPWLTLDDESLLQKAGLWKRDFLTGQEGYTLASVLLFGKDEVIQQVVPHYKIDALLRIDDQLRYDDREYIQTNLIEAYEKLLEFVVKHLPDKFYLQGTQRISLRSTIFREIIANIIAHREYTNALVTTFVIRGNVIETENANNPHGSGPIAPDSFAPYPKNPTISKFLMQLGWVEELGSGILNVNKYWPVYSKGTKPQFIEGEAFKIVLPVSDGFFAANWGSNQDGNQDGNYDGNQEAPFRFRGNIRDKKGFGQWISILHELLEPLIQAQYFDLYRDMLEVFPEEWKKVLKFCRVSKTRKEILEESLGISNQTKNFRANVSMLLEHGLLKRTLPEKLQSKNQKYVTSHEGEKLLQLLEDV